MNILIAGIYRSGSTWLYNAVRFLTEEAGYKTKGSFIWHQSEEEFKNKRINECNVIKTHCFYQDNELYFEPDFIITSSRKKEDIINSMKYQREKGIEKQFKNAGNWEEIDIFIGWLNKWRGHRKHLHEVDYTNLANKDILKILKDLNSKLKLKLKLEQLKKVEYRLNELKFPLSGYDKKTLLTPTHIRTKVLNCCFSDWANFSHDNAKSLRSIGVDCTDVKLRRHHFNYPNQSEVVSEDKLRELILDNDIIQIFHSDSTMLEFAKKSGKRIFVYYCDSLYRRKPSAYNDMFNPYVEKSIIALGEFSGLGAINETYLFGGIDIPEFKLKELGDTYKIGHYPSDHEVKGTVQIMKMLEKVKGKYDLLYSGETVSFLAQKKRMAECDIYIELFKPVLDGQKYGSFGITALEAASLGKIVVTQNLSKKVYESVYGKSPLILCDSEREFIYNIEKLLSLSKIEIRKLQIETYQWVKNNHSYEAHGKRVKNVLGI